MTQLQKWIDQLDQTNEKLSLKAEFQVVTPMFIGDGEQKADSIRPPAIKGALRFWWRALNWSRCLQQAGNETSALKQLHDEEAMLFGLAAKLDAQGNQEGGQGLFTLKVQQPAGFKTINDWPKDGNSPCGFLGFGLWKTNKDPQREAIPEDVIFKINLSFKSKVSVEQKQQLRDALAVFGLLGGLGSRARRGFGSIALTRLDDASYQFKNKDEYIKALKQHLPNLDADSAKDWHKAPVTCWSSKSALVYYGQDNLARKALDILNTTYKEIRGGMQQSQKARFGLPLAKFDPKNRRSSPFIMHIHPIGQEFVALTSILPAAFHHEYDLSQSEIEQPLSRLKQAAREQWL